MRSEEIIGWLIIVCCIAAIFIIFAKPFKMIARACLNGAIGISLIFICNFLLQSTGIQVGINYFTAIFTGILGIPGVLGLYIMRIII